MHLSFLIYFGIPNLFRNIEPEIDPESKFKVTASLIFHSELDPKSRALPIFVAKLQQL